MISLIAIAWVFVGLCIAYDSAVMAYARGRFHFVVDCVIAPTVFAILGPIPIVAKLIRKLDL